MEVTLIQYATVAGRFLGVTESSVKPKPKKANKAEVIVEESPKEETQANATTPKPKARGQRRGTPQTSPAKVESKPPAAQKGGKSGGKGKRGKSESQQEKRKQQCTPFLRGLVKRVINESMNTRSTMMDDLSPSAQRFSRSMMKLSRDSMKQRRKQHLEVE